MMSIPKKKIEFVTYPAGKKPVYSLPNKSGSVDHLVKSMKYNFDVDQEDPDFIETAKANGAKDSVVKDFEKYHEKVLKTDAEKVLVSTNENSGIVPPTIEEDVVKDDSAAPEPETVEPEGDKPNLFIIGGVVLFLILILK